MWGPWLEQFDRSSLAAVVAGLACWLGAGCLCPSSARSDDSKHAGLGLDPSLFDSVQDMTLGVRDEETHAYYEVLGHAMRVDDARLRQAARDFQDVRRGELPEFRDKPERPFPVFRDLFQNYARYRGKPVTLEGHVRQIVPFPPDPDILRGVESLYETWIYTDDSDSNPAVVVLTSIPKGLPLGRDLVEQVSVTGYFFKMYAYRAQDTTRLAPLLLAQRLEWFPQEDSVAWRPSGSVYLVLSAIATAFVWLVVRAAQRDRRIQTNRRSKDREPPTQPVTDAEPPDSVSPKNDRR